MTAGIAGVLIAGRSLKIFKQVSKNNRTWASTMFLACLQNSMIFTISWQWWILISLNCESCLCAGWHLQAAAAGEKRLRVGVQGWAASTAAASAVFVLAKKGRKVVKVLLTLPVSCLRVCKRQEQTSSMTALLRGNFLSKRPSLIAFLLS